MPSVIPPPLTLAAPPSRLFWLVAARLLRVWLGVVLGLAGIFSLHALGLLLEQAAAGAMSPALLLWALALSVPRVLDWILPVTALLAVLWVVGQMRASGEWWALAGLGAGPSQLAAPLLAFALLAAIATAGNALWLNPRANAERTALEQAAQATVRLAEPGRFVALAGGKVVLYFESSARPERDRAAPQIDARVDGDGVTGERWLGITVVQPAGAEGVVAVERAREGREYRDVAGRRWVELLKGARYEGVPGQADWRVLTYERHALVIDQAVAAVGLKRTAIATGALLEQAEGRPDLRAEWYWRWSQPVLVFVAVLAAWGLMGDARRHAIPTALLLALVGMVLYQQGVAMGRAAVADEGAAPWLAMGLWHLVALSAALLLLWRGSRG